MLPLPVAASGSGWCAHWANPQCIMKDRSSDQHVLNAGSTQVRAREEARTASEDGTQGSSQPCARFKSNVESCWSTSLYPATLAAEKDHPNGLVAEHRSATHSSHALLLPRPVGRDELKVHRKSGPSVSCLHAPASIKNVRVRASTRVRTGVMSRACSLIKWSARDSEGRWRGLVFFRDRLRDVRIHVHLRTSSSQLAARRAKRRGQVASALGARAIGSVQQCGCAAGTGYPHPARSATRAARASHAARSECAPRRSS